MTLQEAIEDFNQELFDADKARLSADPFGMGVYFRRIMTMVDPKTGELTYD